jgi:soluble lytic murein transglycosylase-like protein
MGRRWHTYFKRLITLRKVLFVFGGIVLLTTVNHGEAVVGSDVTPADQSTDARALPPAASAGVAVDSSNNTISSQQADSSIDVRTVHQWLADYRTGLTISQKRLLAEALYNESQRYGLQPTLVMALIATESSFFNWSRSERGAVGLMQLRPVTAEAMVRQWSASGERVKWSGEETLFDPVINLRLGLGYLSQLVRQFGDLKIALTAYNYGPTRVSEWLAECKPLPLGYANRIIGLSQELREQSDQSHTGGEPALGNQQA